MTTYYFPSRNGKILSHDVTTAAETLSPLPLFVGTPTVDAADELVAGRAYPVRDFRARLNARAAAAHLAALRSFWLDVAAALVAQADAGCRESLFDARIALAKADFFTPKAAR